MSKIIIQGVQWDAKSSFQQGPAKAPALIREALHCGSANSYAENGQSIDDERVDADQDYEIKEYFDIERITRDQLAKGHRVVSLGGDHSMTYPIIKAYYDFYPKLDILHIDAHADLYHDYEGDPYSHACPFARIMESEYAVRLVQVGIRTLNPHQRAQVDKYMVEVHEMRNLDLTQINRFDNPLYISLDLDGLDPAYAPGVSHHEPGGLSTRQVINLIHQVKATVVGADIVEYNPDRDIQGQTAHVAAKLLKEIVGKMLS